MEKIADTIYKHSYLSYPEQQILKDIVQNIPSMYLTINRVLLYGSKARGDFLEESDLDILFITDYALPRTLKFEIYDLIFELEVKYDTVISAFFVTADDFRTKKTPFLKQVHREGITLWSRG
jgi:predicted nucleotidyltransferase